MEHETYIFVLWMPFCNMCKIYNRKVYALTLWCLNVYCLSGSLWWTNTIYSPLLPASSPAFNTITQYLSFIGLLALSWSGVIARRSALTSFALTFTTNALPCELFGFLVRFPFQTLIRVILTLAVWRAWMFLALITCNVVASLSTRSGKRVASCSGAVLKAAKVSGLIPALTCVR